VALALETPDDTRPTLCRSSLDALIASMRVDTSRRVADVCVRSVFVVPRHEN
jgi:hypothetical protein